jgi:hypothetical protein
LDDFGGDIDDVMTWLGRWLWNRVFNISNRRRYTKDQG